MRARGYIAAAVLLLTPAIAGAQAVVVGEVFDSTTSAPLVDAQITVLGPNVKTRTDGRGAYRIEVPAGVHTLILAHPRLSSLPIPVPLRDVHLSDGDTRRVDFHLPSMATILGQACGTQADGVLVGRVRDELVEESLGRARVRVRASDRTAYAATHEVKSDPNGVYRFCGLPTGIELSVAADFHGQGGHTVAVNLPSDRAVLLDFDLDVTEPSRIMGRVVDVRSGDPVPHAAVSMDDGETRITDPDGRFFFHDLPPGVYGLRSSHIAYAGQLDTVTVSGNEVIELEIRLAAEVLRLPPLVVLSRSRPMVAAGHLATFETRRRHGHGVYFTRDEIERVAPFSITALLRRVPGLRIVPNGLGTYSVFMSRQPIKMNMLARNDSEFEDTRAQGAIRESERGLPTEAVRVDPDPAGCHVKFYLDGGPIRLGDGDSIDRIVPVQSVAGVEVYRGASELPLSLLGSNTRCGAVVIWTRHGE